MRNDGPLNLCIIYDCLFPWTVGGAERWLRTLAEALVAEGHQVTYLTRVQWPPDDPPRIPGVTVVPVSRRDPLYGPQGNRTVGEPVRFGWGVFTYLLRRRNQFDVVHTAVFPYFSLLGAAVALKGTRTILVADWYEVWSAQYWRHYLGALAGQLGWALQYLCTRVRQRAFVFSELHARRLRDSGFRAPLTKLAGLYAEPPDSVDPGWPEPREPLVVFAGRHIPDKQVTLIPAALALARSRIPGLRALIVGDGPEFPNVRDAIDRSRVSDIVETPGFVESERLRAALARAMCLLLPSRREGYGLIVVEAAARGTPSIVVAGPDNAAVELIDPGVNGFVAPSSSPEDLAAAIIALYEAGATLRESTRAWFATHGEALSVRSAVAQVVESYARFQGSASTSL